MGGGGKGEVNRLNSFADAATGFFFVFIRWVFGFSFLPLGGLAFGCETQGM